MSTPATALYVQRRPTRAGAQTSLFRLITSSSRKSLLLCSEAGWLTDTLDGAIVKKWSSPRSLPARLGGLTRFAKKIANEVREATIVVANDHHECPIALAIAKTLALPCVAILRTPGMSHHDFQKYHCDDCDSLFIVGDELSQKVQQWSSSPLVPFVEGFLESEFTPPPPAPAQFPSEILIAGSEEPRKGFQDLLQALQILEKEHPAFQLKKVVLTGQIPDAPIPQLDCEVDFVGRVEDFIPFAQGFSFAIHPSRHETFGLAPLELIIGGIPTLCTRTGCADGDLLPASWLTPPSSPRDLAKALLDWKNNWSLNRAQLTKASRTIHERFAITATSRSFFQTIDDLSGAS
ncbi:glycosyltransferase family 4 protein [Verrucomicrobiaceae bacterium 227]